MPEKPTPEAVAQELSRNEQERLVSLIHELVGQVRKPGLDELVRLLGSDKFDDLTEDQITNIGNYHAITISEEKFFNKAFSTSKEAASILRIARHLSRDTVLEDLQRLQESLKE